MLQRCRTLYLSKLSFLILICSSPTFRAANPLLMVSPSNHYIKVSSSMLKYSNLRHLRDQPQPAAKVCPV